MKDNSSVFLWRYTLDKKSPSKRFKIFRLGWWSVKIQQIRHVIFEKHESVFGQTLHHSSVLSEMTLLFLF